MNELDAARWIQNQPGLKVYIGKDREVTLTDGESVEASGQGFLGAVIALQEVLHNLKAPPEIGDFCTDGMCG